MGYIHYLTTFFLTYISLAMGAKNMFCYYTNWARYRKYPGNFTVSSIDPYLCTHIVYAFADISNGIIKFGDEHDREMCRELQKLKIINPQLKSLLSVGGFAAGSDPFAKITKDESSKLKFANSVIKHLREFGFDGLDIDWEYPLNLAPNGRQKFTDLIMYMNTAFGAEASVNIKKQHRLLLTAAVSGGDWAIDSSYSIPHLAIYLDYVLILSYDYHGSWENRTGLHSGLVGRGIGDTKNVQWVVKKYLTSGVPREKLVLGIPTFGRTWRLSDPANHGVYAAAVGPGGKGEHTEELGILGFNEICVRLAMPGWTNITDPIQMTPFAWRNEQWIGYEDERSVSLKANYIAAENLGGAMFWSLAMDDFLGICAEKPFPLINRVKTVFDQLDIASRAAVMARAMPVAKEAPAQPTLKVAPSNTNILNRLGGLQMATQTNQIQMGNLATSFNSNLGTRKPAAIPATAMISNTGTMTTGQMLLAQRFLQQGGAPQLPAQAPNIAGVNSAFSNMLNPAMSPGQQAAAFPTFTQNLSPSLTTTSIGASSLTVPSRTLPSLTSSSMVTQALQPAPSPQLSSTLLSFGPGISAIDAASSAIAQNNVVAQMAATIQAATNPSSSAVNGASAPSPVAAKDGDGSQPADLPSPGSQPANFDALMTVMENNKAEEILEHALTHGENWSAMAGLPPPAPLGRQNGNPQSVPNIPALNGHIISNPPPPIDPRLLTPQYQERGPSQDHFPSSTRGRQQFLPNPEGSPPFFNPGPPPSQRFRHKFVFHNRRPVGIPDHGLITQPAEAFRPFQQQRDPFDTRSPRPYPRQHFPQFSQGQIGSSRQELHKHPSPPGLRGFSSYHGRLEGFKPDDGQGQMAKEVRAEEAGIYSVQEEEPLGQSAQPTRQTYVKVEPASVESIDVTEVQLQQKGTTTVVSSGKGRRPQRKRKFRKQNRGYSETVYSNMPAPAGVRR